MQTEEKQADTNPEDRSDQTTGLEQHWHVVTLKEGEVYQDLALTGSLTSVITRIHQILHVSYETAGDELVEISKEDNPSPLLAGEQLLRVTRLSDLEDAFDPKLFKHHLFDDFMTQELLEEAFVAALEEFGEVGVLPDRSLRIYGCDEQCEPLTQAEQGREKGHGDLSALLSQAEGQMAKVFAAAGIPVQAIKLEVGRDEEGNLQFSSTISKPGTNGQQ